MSEQRKEKGHGRRDVLKLASLGSVAAAAATVVGRGEARAAEPAPRGGGYRETEHVKTYYETARF
ncbi:MAG: formate dehydrogenase [Geminicoccaceae bacterium]|nr:formate dehydrogenase [Geminicoccaceae bacterium]MCS7268623.1 formate dehydrogenase [Geminicoccaceae bacterium]MDW8125352.1 formate dehydrogenase [Geminicoccaceae bacterium]MDW8342630.1 formate dehydrogenase [Geminicoccaceae bacterium]